MDPPGEGANAALVRALEEAGWTSYELARRINAVLGPGYVHRTTPRSWCLHGGIPRPPLPAVVSRLLSEEVGRLVSPRDLWPTSADATALITTDHGLVAPWTSDSIGRITVDLDIGANPSRLVCLSGNDLLRFARRWDLGAADSRMKPGDRHWRAGCGEPVLHHIEGELSRLRAIDDSTGGLALLTLVSSQQRLLASLAMNYGPKSWQSRQALSVLAQYCQFAGWLALDLGLHARSQREFFVGLRLCDLVGDVDLSALILSCLGVQALCRQRPQDASPLLDVALAAPVRSVGADAILWTRRARVSAALGDTAECQRALERARTLADERQQHPQPAWTYWLTHDLITAEEGRCWLELDDSRQARRHLTRTVVSRSTTGRDRVLYGAALAQAHLLHGEIDQACAELRETIDFLPGTSSQRCRDLVSDVHGALVAFGDHAVRHRQALEDIGVALAG